jgi:hypothetical protein
MVKTSLPYRSRIIKEMLTENISLSTIHDETATSTVAVLPCPKRAIPPVIWLAITILFMFMVSREFY